jgi:excisionase family DNA binding protein
MDPLEPLLTTDEVAAYLKVDVVTVRRLVTRGELAAYRVGSEYRFARADLLDYLARQHVPARSVASKGAGLAAQPLVGMVPQTLCAQDLVGLSPLFTRRARRSLKLAAEEARASGRGYLGTEHLLTGLICEQEGVAARVLAEIGIAVEAVRAAVASADEWPEHLAADVTLRAADLPATEHVRQALHEALAQRAAWEHGYLGTEHLLFGLTRVLDGNAALLLEQFGTTPDTVQAEVLRIVRLGEGR